MNAILLTFSAALIFTHESMVTDFAASMLLLDRSAEFLRCGMLVFLWIVAGLLGITQHHHLWGIIFGFGLYSATGLTTAIVDVATNKMCSHWLTPIPHFAYLAATIIWAIYMLKPEADWASQAPS